MSTSIRSAINEGAQILGAAGINEPRRDALSLMCRVLEGSRIFVIAHAEDQLSESHAKHYRQLIERRATREPLQYITGHQEFFGLDFEVTPDVLIPRPETEIIVEAALEVLKDDENGLMLDVGTGSGCIVISLLHKLPGAQAIATDISPAALRVAQRNAERHKVATRLELIEADGFPSTAHEFSVIVSNPPYVTEEEFAGLQPEVRDYEPRSALVSGANGLAHVGMLLRDAPAHVRRGGHFIFEIGFGQSDAVERLIDQVVWNVVDVRKDLQGIPRTFVLRRK